MTEYKYSSSGNKEIISGDGTADDAPSSAVGWSDFLRKILGTRQVVPNSILNFIFDDF